MYVYLFLNICICTFTYVRTCILQASVGGDASEGHRDAAREESGRSDRWGKWKYECVCVCILSVFDKISIIEEI